MPIDLSWSGARLLATAVVLLSACAPTVSPSVTLEGHISPSRVASSVFVTLGTQGGPLPSAGRSQPANLLILSDQAILIDVGDGAAEQLAKAGVPLGDVRTVFLSHLHFDHTGGLYGFLGMRLQGMNPGTVTIYGPRGTKALVDGLLAAMQPSFAVIRRPETEIQVVEITDGSRVVIGDVTVLAARNSHYSASGQDPQTTESLSFRFDLPDRSIAYTGDTGPSENVERLALNVDLLVSEAMDVEAALAEIRAARPDIPDMAFLAMRRHFEQEHLTGEQAGLLAQHANARRLVITHMGGTVGGPEAEALRAAASTNFEGDISVASDLDRF